MRYLLTPVLLALFACAASAVTPEQRAIAAFAQLKQPTVKPAAKQNPACPHDCQRRAKAAFAFAAMKGDAKPAVAPMPKPKAPACPCGPGCECAGGCPGTCAVGGISALLPPAPRVIAPKVAGKLHDPDHTCPKCGQSQFTVHRTSGGEHSHKCAACGTEWWHPNPGAAAAPVYALPSSTVGGCVGGNCPTPTYDRWYPGKLLGR